MAKKLINILIVLVVLGGIGGFMGYRWYHKPAKNAATEKVDITISATDLAKAFVTDEKAANGKYLDKNIQVSGTVAETDKNQDGGLMVVLETGDPMNEVQCTMQDKNATATKGQTLTIKGFCSGNNMGVALRDCVIK